MVQEDFGECEVISGPLFVLQVVRWMNRTHNMSLKWLQKEYVFQDLCTFNIVIKFNNNPVIKTKVKYSIIYSIYSAPNKKIKSIYSIYTLKDKKGGKKSLFE